MEIVVLWRRRAESSTGPEPAGERAPEDLSPLQNGRLLA
jgi:hypothetical protein